MQDNGQCCCYAIADAVTALQSAQVLENAVASSLVVLWHMPVLLTVHRLHYFCMLLRTQLLHEEGALILSHLPAQVGAIDAYATTHDSHLPLFAAVCQSSTSHTSIHAFSPPWLLQHTDKMERLRTHDAPHSTLFACPVPVLLYTPMSPRACKTAFRCVPLERIRWSERSLFRRLLQTPSPRTCSP